MDWILELRSNLNIPHTLSEIIDDDKNLEKMSLMAFNDPSTSTNPIPVNAEDFLKMYIKFLNFYEKTHEFSIILNFPFNNIICKLTKEPISLFV